MEWVNIYCEEYLFSAIMDGKIKSTIACCREVIGPGDLNYILDKQFSILILSIHGWGISGENGLRWF